MGLREQAAADLKAILEDDDGFAWPITVEDPNGLSASLKGSCGDIVQVIDFETGQAMAGRHAHVIIAIASLTAAGFTELPRGIADTKSRPWVVRFNDIAGKACSFKVREAMPDRTIGQVTCTLEFFDG
jgi:hypothetical protein